MTQDQRLDYLLRVLYAESSREDLPKMHASEEKRDMLRALFNMRPPFPADDAFLEVQDAYLQEEIAAKGITDAAALPVISETCRLRFGEGILRR